MILIGFDPEDTDLMLELVSSMNIVSAVDEAIDDLEDELDVMDEFMLDFLLNNAASNLDEEEYEYISKNFRGAEVEDE